MVSHDSKVQPRSSALKQNPGKSDILRLSEVKRLYYGQMKGKRIQILDGAHAGKIGTFLSWNSGRGRFNIDDKTASVDLSQNVRLVDSSS
jgi:hypothetical protein